MTLLLGMCAELPPGAFRVSGGLHRRGRSQRVLLPQSPDLTCGRVILQRLRWQRSLTVYGQITSLLLQLVDQQCSWASPLLNSVHVCVWAPVCICLLYTVHVGDTVCVCVFSQGVINLESLGKRGYRVPPSGTIQVVRSFFRSLFS